MARPCERTLSTECADSRSQDLLSEFESAGLRSVTVSRQRFHEERVNALSACRGRVVLEQIAGLLFGFGVASVVQQRSYSARGIVLRGSGDQLDGENNDADSGYGQDSRGFTGSTGTVDRKARDLDGSAVAR